MSGPWVGGTDPGTGPGTAWDDPSSACRCLLPEDALFGYDLCRGHTYYLQVLFNRLFATSGPADRDAIVRILLAIVREQDAIMATLRSALTRKQCDLFAAISKEGEVDMPTGAAFMKKYVLPSSAALVTSLQALIDRELVYISDHISESGKPVYLPAAGRRAVQPVHGGVVQCR